MEQAVTEIQLPEALQIMQVAEWRQALLARVLPAGAVRLVGADTKQVDTAGLQLLACLLTEWTRQGLSVQWRGVSPELYRAARTLGLLQTLQLTDSNSALQD